MAKSFISEYVDEMNDPGAVIRIATAKARLREMRERESLNIGEIQIEIEVLSEVGIMRFAIDGRLFQMNNREMGEIIESIYTIKVNYNNYKDIDVARFAIDQLIRRITQES